MTRPIGVEVICQRCGYVTFFRTKRGSRLKNMVCIKCGASGGTFKRKWDFEQKKELEAKL